MYANLKNISENKFDQIIFNFIKNYFIYEISEFHNKLYIDNYDYFLFEKIIEDKIYLFISHPYYNNYQDLCYYDYSNSYISLINNNYDNNLNIVNFINKQYDFTKYLNYFNIYKNKFEKLRLID